MENEATNRLQHYINSFRDESSRAVMGPDTALLSSHTIDVEGLKEDAPQSSPSEYHVPTATKYLYLSLYFALNLALTIYNKAILGKVHLDLESARHLWELCRGRC